MQEKKSKKSIMFLPLKPGHKNLFNLWRELQALVVCVSLSCGHSPGHWGVASVTSVGALWHALKQSEASPCGMFLPAHVPLLENCRFFSSVLFCSWHFAVASKDFKKEQFNKHLSSTFPVLYILYSVPHRG